jgi:hypothetical protein
MQGSPFWEALSTTSQRSLAFVQFLYNNACCSFPVDQIRLCTVMLASLMGP